MLSAEVVLPNGNIVELPSVPKHGVGPELTQLFVGSEGTLGVITAVRVKLRKVPVKRRFSVFSFETLSHGIEAGRQIMTSGLRPSCACTTRTPLPKALKERCKQAWKA